MSAFYALAYDDRVELLTDAAVYSDNGTLLSVQRKVWTSDHLPLAITGRGQMAVVELFAATISVLSSNRTVDATLEAVSRLLARRKGKAMSSEVEIVIAAVSETRGPGIYYFATSDIHGHFAPYELHNVNEIGGGTELTEEEIARLPDASNNLLAIALPLFDAMRSKKGANPANPSLPELHGIGGHIDLTIVGKAGAATERLWTWDEDVIGEKIDPTGASIAIAKAA